MNRYCHCLLFAFIRVNIHGGISPFHGGNTGSNPVGDAIFQPLLKNILSK